jgi:hypothetical protein
MMLRLAIALVRAWTWLFTVGMPDTVCEWRRAEIQCDLWEHSHDHRPTAAQVTWRLMRGIPADILWRVEEEAMQSGKMIVVAASLGVAIGAGAMWLYEAMRLDFLPTPPPVRMEVGGSEQSWPVIPPPPPPPPPPPGQKR